VALFDGALHVLFSELPVALGQPPFEVADLLWGQPVQQPGRLARGGAQCLPYLDAHRIVTPFEVLLPQAAQHARRGFVGELRVLRQRGRPVPGEDGADPPVQLLGLLVLEVEIVVRLPAQEHVGVVVGEARDAAT